jgi:hypothetical protein
MDDLEHALAHEVGTRVRWLVNAIEPARLEGTSAPND